MTVRSIRAGRGTLVALSAVLTLSLSGPAYAAGEGSAADTPTAPPEQITLEVLAANGSGCPDGTVKVAGNSDRTGFRLTYRDFVAEAGGSAAVPDGRKNCQVAVRVDVPNGWTFAIAKAEYRGRARLDSGATGLHRTNYYFQGSSDNNYSDLPLTGPLNAWWTNTDGALILAYARCDVQRVLNINTELRVYEGTSNKKSSVSMRSSEGDVDTLFNFAWKKC